MAFAGGTLGLRGCGVLIVHGRIYADAGHGLNGHIAVVLGLPSPV
tara:strand:+ start:4484 stop:4618 length:135 start_codon:yes stop_codon:yes gene_type:complete